jgi:hypothetical protein
MLIVNWYPFIVSDIYSCQIQILNTVKNYRFRLIFWELNTGYLELEQRSCLFRPELPLVLFSIITTLTNNCEPRT